MNKINAEMSQKANLSGADFQVLKRGGFEVWDTENFIIEENKSWAPYLNSTDVALTISVATYWRYGKRITVLFRGVISLATSESNPEIRFYGLPYAPNGMSNAYVERGCMCLLVSGQFALARTGSNLTYVYFMKVDGTPVKFNDILPSNRTLLFQIEYQIR